MQKTEEELHRRHPEFDAEDGPIIYEFEHEAIELESQFYKQLKEMIEAW